MADTYTHIENIFDSQFIKWVKGHSLDSEGLSAIELIEKYQNSEMSRSEILEYMGY